MSTCVLKVLIISSCAGFCSSTRTPSLSVMNCAPGGTVVKLPPDSTFVFNFVQSLFRLFCWSKMASRSLLPQNRPGILTFLRMTSGNTSGL